MGDRVRGTGPGVRQGRRDPQGRIDATGFLTADLGNSRLKLRLWRDGGGAEPELCGSADLEGEQGLAEGLAGALGGLGDPPSAGVLSAVASRDLLDRVAVVLRSHVRGELLVSPDPGLEIRCREPERVGSDRLFAALGALSALGRSVLVVDAGTALTVDAALAPAGSGRGIFLGGAIAPGPQLLAAALARGTANLAAVRPRPGAPALGRDTRSALEAGVSVGFRGAAHALVEGVAAEAGLGDAPVVVTGGARAFLLEPAAFTDRELVVRSDLVHLGLLVAARPTLGAPGG